MIRITVELLPHGDASRAKVLGTARIWNTLQGTTTQGVYKTEFLGETGEVWRQGEVHEFPRQRLLAWDLLAQALNQVEAGA